MSEVNVTKPYQRRRRFSGEFKAQIVAQCLEPGASVSRISLDNGLNANMVRRWISEARRAPKTRTTTPGFVPVNLPAATSAPGNPSVSDKRSTIRIEIPRAGGAVVVEWPAEQAHQCAALLRDLLG
jgi:transposase